MSRYKVKITITLELDTDEYHIPADFKFKEQLVDDLTEAIERSLSIEVTGVAINGVRKINDECNYD